MMAYRALTLLVAAGCATQPSVVEPAAPRSDELSADHISLEGQLRSNGVVVQADLTLRNAGALELGSDVLSLTELGEPGEFRVFTETHIGPVVQFPSTDTHFELVLSREQEEVTVPVELPPAFTLVAPVEPVSRATPILLEWLAADEVEVLLSVQGTCIGPGVHRALAYDRVGASST